ncbi:MAG: hypothetical protein DRG33_00895 [Deltaproteobacteria bacterium]|nr:MAG: hypothetical protein DRG33_00895 [Deltaproteobacteria bacterium]
MKMNIHPYVIDGLVLYFDSRMNYRVDNGNLTKVYDWSGYGNHGTPHNGVKYIYDEEHGYAFYFDGVDDYVEVPDSPSLNFTVNNQLTVEAWVIDSVVDDTYRAIASKDGEFLLRRTNAGEGNDFEFFIYDGSSWEPRVDSGVVPERGKWYFVVGVFDGSEVKIYVNGELKRSKDRVATLSDTTNPLKIGMFNGGHRWNGVITSIRIYNHALNEDEIKLNYDSVKYGIGVL